MADAGKRWILGCGLVGGLIALAIVVTGVGATLRLRAALAPVHEARASWESLTAAYGDVGDYVPAADGALEPGRLQVFLAARERLLGSQAELDSLFAAPPRDKDLPFLQGLLRSFGAVADVVGPLARYADVRHRILMDLGMGPGEYAWITALAYHGWLGYAPDAVPRRPDGTPAFAGGDGYFSPDAVRARYVEAVGPLLRNAMIAAGAAAGLDHPQTVIWREELARLESDPGGRPWPHGVPPAAATSLEPFRARLEAGYRDGTTALEWPAGDGWDWGRNR